MFRRVFDRRFLAGLAGSSSPRRGLQHVQRNHIHNRIPSGVPTNHDDFFHPLHLPVMFVLWLGCNIEQFIRDNRKKKLSLKINEEERRRRAKYNNDIKEKLESVTEESEAKRAYRDLLRRYEKEAEILDGRPIGS